jgi:hypothetical protein
MKTTTQRAAEVSAAIDRLAALFPCGALQAATDPAGFIDAVTAEVTRLRAAAPRPPADPGSPCPVFCGQPCAFGEPCPEGRSRRS